MSEYVWTILSIGGQMTPSIASKLHALASDYFEEADETPEMEAGSYVTYQGSRNYGHADECEAFCHENGLSYVLSHSSAPGAFASFVKRWSPGWPDEIVMESNDDGVPLASIDEIEAALKGGNIDQLLDRMKSLLQSSLPAIVIKEEAKPMDNQTIVLTHREFYTVLAALRFWQRKGDETAPEYDLACEGCTALSKEEVDRLCEAINTA